MNGAPCRSRGFLTKSAVSENMEGRWFKLTAKTLFYYASPTATAPLGTISLHGADVQSCAHNKYEHCFQLVPSSSVQSSSSLCTQHFDVRDSDNEKRSGWRALSAGLTPKQASVASGYFAKMSCVTQFRNRRSAKAWSSLSLRDRGHRLLCRSAQPLAVITIISTLDERGIQ